jgi:hypothetical protein
VLDVLQPYSTEAGGPLKIQHVSYVEGRGNIIVEYPGKADGGIVSYVGAHLVRGCKGGEVQLTRQILYGTTVDR